MGCKGLERVTLGGSLISIDDCAFVGCDKIKYSKFDNGLYLGNEENPFFAFVKTTSSKVRTCTVHADCKIIADSAFLSSKNLVQVSMPKGVLTIGKWAFYACESLSAVTIPEGVTVLDKHAFSSCTKLKTIKLPTTLRVLGEEAFSRCKMLKAIARPDGLTAMGSFCFKECSALKDVQLPSTLEAIPCYAFIACKSLEEIKIPEGVKDVCLGAFEGCESLVSLHLPRTLTEIGSIASDPICADCSALAHIYFAGTKEEWSKTRIENIRNYHTGNYTLHCIDDTPEG